MKSLNPAACKAEWCSTLTPRAGIEIVSCEHSESMVVLFTCVVIKNKKIWASSNKHSGSFQRAKYN